MFVIGLTGSIGMGKSVTAGIFRDLGIPVHDADQAVHELYRSDAVAPIGAVFPTAIGPDGVDRGKLAEIVLADREALKRLEAIVHPLVLAHRKRFVEAHANKGARLVVLDIPLLFETGAERDVDLVLVVSAPAPVQKARVLARPGMTQARFDAIVAKQMPDAEKRRRAHVVIDTSRGVPAARHQVNEVLRAVSAHR